MLQVSCSPSFSTLFLALGTPLILEFEAYSRYK